MPEMNGSDLKVGDVVWLFDAARKPPQRKRRVRGISLKDGEARAGDTVSSVPWSFVRSDPVAVRVELDAEEGTASGEQVFPCTEPLEATTKETAGISLAVGGAGIFALVAIGVAVLIAFGPLAFVLAQVIAAIALAVVTKVVLPRLGR
jgi:hypothetical protein